MKNSRFLLSTLFVFLIAISCEKEDPNPFLGTWEDTEITDLGTVLTSMVYRSDMTVAFTMVVTANGHDTTTSTDYNYSYTSTTITIWEDGGQKETTEYIINDTHLVLSPGTDYERIYTISS